MSAQPFSVYGQNEPDIDLRSLNSVQGNNRLTAIIKVTLIITYCLKNSNISPPHMALSPAGQSRLKNIIIFVWSFIADNLTKLIFYAIIIHIKIRKWVDICQNIPN